MSMRMTTLVLLAIAIGASARAGAARQADDARDAMNLGRTHDQALYDAFNAGYRLTPSGVVDSVEVVTEFRRAVLLVREHAMKGEYSFTANDLTSALAPLNTYATPPKYDLYIRTGSQSKPVAAPSIKRDPVYALGSAGPGNTIVAVRLEASFPRADVMNATEPTVVLTDEHGSPVWQTRIDLTRFR